MISDQSPVPLKSEDTSDISRALWHGAIETSTDTLIPAEPVQKPNSDNSSRDHITSPTMELVSGDRNLESTSTVQASKISQSYNNLPKVHIRPNAVICPQRVDAFPHHLDLQVPRETTGNPDRCKPEKLAKDANANANANGSLLASDGYNGEESLFISPDLQRFVGQSPFDAPSTGGRIRRNTFGSSYSRDMKFTAENGRWVVCTFSLVASLIGLNQKKKKTLLSAHTNFRRRGSFRCPQHHFRRGRSSLYPVQMAWLTDSANKT